MTNIVQDLTNLTERFALEVLGMPIPLTPTRLEPGRKDWAISALTEETAEFVEASTLEDEADALIDLAYFALGRIVEMGLAPRALFEEVHRANMAKKRGELSKRPNSKGFDAVKPEDWEPPFLEPLLRANLEDVLMATQMRKFEDFNAGIPRDPMAHVLRGFLQSEQARKKILILGYGRHGKDEAATILSEEYNMDFVSSSMFCAGKVIMPLIQPGGKLEHVMPAYGSVQACFDDRHNFRAEWFNAIDAFNRPDATALGRAIFNEFDIYVGVRSARELHALRNSGDFDMAIWIDRSAHVPAEDRSSCTVEPWMADFVVDNNGTLDELRINLLQLMDNTLMSPQDKVEN